MSALVAGLYFPPRQVDADVFQRAIDLGALWGADATWRWFGDGVALGCCHRCATPEGIDGLPRFGELGQESVLCADLRLDNREVLIGQLRQLGERFSDQASDASLAAACYQQWGVECFSRLVGDYALVIWDGQRQQLVCARDALGRRPLFFNRSHRRFLCASYIRQLFCDADTPTRLSELNIARFLAASDPVPASTVFEEIQRLPAGHYLLVDKEGRLRQTCFWNPAAICLGASRSIASYAEDFRDRFLQSVSARLRSTNLNIGLHISGGFDSTAVAAAVHDENQRSSRGLAIWAFVNVGEHPAADERIYREEVLRCYPMPQHVTASADYWAFRPAPLLEQRQDEPYLAPYAARLLHDLEVARRLGIKVILTGDGGDEVGGSSWYLVDLLWRGKWAQLWPEFKARAAGKRQSSLGLMRALAGGWWRWLRRLTRTEPLKPPSWLHTDLRRRLGQSRFVPAPPPHWNPARADLYDRLRSFWNAPLASNIEAVYNHFGVELRHPFLDRRLFEWAMSVPPYLCGEQGRVKAPLRRALQDIVPEAVAKRADKGNYLFYWDLGLGTKERTRILQLFDRPISEEMGFINSKRFLASYEGYCEHGRINRAHLWNTIALEQWLRNQNNRP